MRVLLAGALGTVGSGLHRAFTADGHSVIALSQRAPLAAHPDVIDPAAGAALLRSGGIDLVVNAAGRGDLRGVARSELEVTRILGEAAREHRTPAVLISTIRVLEGSTGPVGEGDDPVPGSPYARANAENERVWEEQGSGSILRLANVFAVPASADAPQARLLPWSLAMDGITDGRIAVRSVPSTTKAFIDLDDAARACIAIAAAGEAPRRYAALPGLSLSLRELAEMSRTALAEVGRQVEVTFGDDARPGQVWLPGRLQQLGWASTLTQARIQQAVTTWVQAVTAA